MVGSGPARRPAVLSVRSYGPVTGGLHGRSGRRTEADVSRLFDGGGVGSVFYTMVLSAPGTHR